MFELKDRVALVTGASGGIGRAIAFSLSALGAKLALSGTREDALQETAKICDGETRIFPCNLSNRAAVDNLVPQIVDAYGALDILVNNAGITKDNIFMRMKDEEFEQVIEINLMSAFRLCRAALKPMMRQRFGRVISITSVVGVMGNAGQGNYAASKAAMIGMSKSLAQEVASRGITVNCIAPGFIKSAMTDALNDKQKESILSTIPASRLGEGDEIAAAVAYLSSEQAGYVTGQTLHVNGGMVMI